MTNLRAADLPTLTIIGAPYGVFISADLDDQHPWRGTTVPPEKTDAEMDVFLVEGAEVLRVGGGIQG